MSTVELFFAVCLKAAYVIDKIFSIYANNFHNYQHSANSYAFLPGRSIADSFAFKLPFTYLIRVFECTKNKFRYVFFTSFCLVVFMIPVLYFFPATSIRALPVGIFWRQNYTIVSLVKWEKNFKLMPTQHFSALPQELKLSIPNSVK